MVDVLRKKGFKALTAEIEEKQGTFRVLVGPVAETTTNKMRADLQGAGFPGNAAIRRTF
jgi:cell division septation protein DedD